MKTGAQLIADERQRQIEGEGWSDAHDDRNPPGNLVFAARCYAGHAWGLLRGLPKQMAMPIGWPWHWSWWKPSDDPVRDLVKAGALIAAEIDRLQRAAK